MKTLLSIVIGLFLSTALLAQDYEFRVMMNKGDNQVKISGGDWQTLKSGTKLNKGDELKLSAGAYAGLVHKSGKTLELKDAGTHKIDDLSAQIGAGTSSITSKYADFVMAKMSGDAKEENRRKYASVTGAVERAADDASIKVLMPTSAEVYSSNPILTWVPVENKKYKVVLKNWTDKTIETKETNESWIKIDLDNPLLAKEQLIIVSVSLADNENISSGEYGIKRVGADEAKKFEDELTELKSALTEESSLNRVILAEFFEQNNLIVDALTNYVTAIQLSPDVDYFKEAFEEFKMRNGLK